MRRYGVWVAAGAAIASVAYGLPQILQVAGMLTSPLDRILIFAPSLVLAPLFLLTLAAALDQAPYGARHWRLASLCLGGLYAALVSTVYIIQLGAVLPGETLGRPGRWEAFSCCEFHAPLTAVDLLGYTYMALALLVLSPTVKPGVFRWVLIANGALAPALALQLIWPQLIVVGAAWLVLFPWAMVLLARHLRHPGL